MNFKRLLRSFLAALLLAGLAAGGGGETGKDINSGKDKPVPPAKGS